MAITIVAIDKKQPPWIGEGIEVYQRRLRPPFDLDWRLLPHEPIADKAAQAESERLLSHCRHNDFIILLDERGQLLDSPTLQQKLAQTFNRSLAITLLIGGAYGVTDALRQRADLVWSLSPLVFPHQLVRLLVAEQMYRSQTLMLGQEYHHQ